MAPADARAVVDSVQSAPFPMPEVDESAVTVPVSVGDVQVRLMRPRRRHRSSASAPLSARRWVDPRKLHQSRSAGAGELAVGANAVVAFVEYSLAPEARYPVQIEQCYAAGEVAHRARRVNLGIRFEPSCSCPLV